MFEQIVLISTGILAVLGLVAHPGYSIMGYYIVALMRPNEMSWSLFESRLSLTLVASTFLGFAFFLIRGKYKKVGGWPVRLLVIMIFHIIYAQFHLIDSGEIRDEQAVWFKFDYYWKMALVAFITSRCIGDPRWVYRVLFALAFSGAYLGCWVNHRYFIRYESPPLGGPGPHLGIWAGLFADRNDFAMMLAMSVCACWYMMVQVRNKYLKLAWLGMIPILVHGILLTESRGGLLGAGASMGYVTFRSKRRVLMAVCSFGGLVCALLFFATEKMLKRYGTIGNYKMDASALARKDAWAVGMKMGVDNPVWGVGLNNFIAAYYDYTTYRPSYYKDFRGNSIIKMDFEWEVRRPKQAHNMWVQTMGERGLLGMIILALFVLSIFWTTWRARVLVRAKNPRGPPGMDVTAVLNAMEGPMIPYLITGFFLSMEHFEYIFCVGMLASGFLSWLKRYPEADDLYADDDASDTKGDADAEGSDGSAPPPVGSPRPPDPAPVEEDRWAHFPPPRRAKLS